MYWQPEPVLPIYTIPSLKEAQTKPESVYSDQIPQLYNLRLGPLAKDRNKRIETNAKYAINFVSLNMMAESSVCGFSATKGWESHENAVKRHQRILRNLKDGLDKKNKVDVILLQEADIDLLRQAELIDLFDPYEESDTANYTQLGKKLKWKFVINKQDGLIILYRCQKLELINETNDKEEIFEDESSGKKQNVIFQIIGTDEKFQLLHVHTPTFSDSTKVERLYRSWFDKADAGITTILAGDTGADIVSSLILFESVASPFILNSAVNFIFPSAVNTKAKGLSWLNNSAIEMAVYNNQVNKNPHEQYRNRGDGSHPTGISDFKPGENQSVIFSQALFMRTSEQKEIKQIDAVSIKGTADYYKNFFTKRHYRRISCIDDSSINHIKEYVGIVTAFNNAFTDANIQLHYLHDQLDYRYFAIWIPLNSSQLQLLEKQLSENRKIKKTKHGIYYIDRIYDSSRVDIFTILKNLIFEYQFNQAIKINNEAHQANHENSHSESEEDYISFENSFADADDRQELSSLGETNTQGNSEKEDIELDDIFVETKDNNQGISEHDEIEVIENEDIFAEQLQAQKTKPYPQPAELSLDKLRRCQSDCSWPKGILLEVRQDQQKDGNFWLKLTVLEQSTESKCFVELIKAFYVASHYLHGEPIAAGRYYQSSPSYYLIAIPKSEKNTLENFFEKSWAILAIENRVALMLKAKELRPNFLGLYSPDPKIRVLEDLKSKIFANLMNSKSLAEIIGAWENQTTYVFANMCTNIQGLQKPDSLIGDIKAKVRMREQQATEESNLITRLKNKR